MGNGMKRGAGSAAFTLVELLVVIAIVGVLVGILLMIAGGVADSMRGTSTRNIMRTVQAAIDHFNEVNPCDPIYDTRYRPTFGALPPYQLAGNHAWQGPAGTVAHAVEPNDTGTTLDGPATLRERLYRDLAFQEWADGTGNVDDWVVLNVEDTLERRMHDDVRALYAYLRLYVPDAVSQVPQWARRPLPSTAGTLLEGEYVNTRGQGGPQQAHRRVEVLGFYDAWGVPLDYCVYFKFTLGLRNDGTKGWVIGSRIPVLRSRGIDAETHAAQIAAYEQSGDRGVFDPRMWIWSEPLPAPAAGVENADGSFKTGTPFSNGWVRGVAGDPAAGYAEEYGYVP